MNEETELTNATDGPTGLPAAPCSGLDHPMTIRDRIDGLEPYKWLILENCPGIHHMMTAIVRAGFSGGGRIRVRYEDCTEKEIAMPAWFKDVEVEKLTLLTFASAMTDCPNDQSEPHGPTTNL